MTTESSSILFGLTRIDYAIQRTARSKTVSIAIDPIAGVVLAAPRAVTVDRLDDIVRTKAPWITKHVRAASERPAPIAPREFVSGESYLYAGRQHTLRVVRGATDDVKLERGRLVVSQPGKSPKPSETRASLVAWYRARANERLPPIVDEWAARIGVAPSRFSIAGQDQRWGSCSSSGHVRINWRIVGAPRGLIEYVVAHELMHLRHPAHDREFWRGLERAMPDAAAARARLAAMGQLFVW